MYDFDLLIPNIYPDFVISNQKTNYLFLYIGIILTKLI